MATAAYGIRTIKLTHALTHRFKGTMNALFLKDLAEKTHRGIRERVENGTAAAGALLRLPMTRKRK